MTSSRTADLHFRDLNLQQSTFSLRAAVITISDQSTMQKRQRPPFKPPRPRANTTGPDAGSSASAGNKSSSKPSISRKQSATTHAIGKTTPSNRRKSDQNNTSSEGLGSSSSKGSRKRSLSLTLSSNDDDDAGDDRLPPSHSKRRESSGNHNKDADDRSLSPDYILAEINTKSNAREEITTSDPQIPPKLLTRLLHRGFQQQQPHPQQDARGSASGTEIAKDANKVVAKYTDVFVREALARAAAERKEATAASEGLQSRIDNYLEVGTIWKSIFRGDIY